MRAVSYPYRLCLWLSLCLVVFGCQKSTPTVPSNAAVTTTPVTVSFGVGESIPAMFEVTIDPASMQASSRPLIARSAAGFQASQFDLDITKFQTSAQFDVRSVQFTAIGDVAVTFRHAHPWKAVDIAQPPSAINRADLGYTGRLLILADLQAADIPSHTFFTDVKANTELIRGADGYVQPGDLLAKSGFNANCFPYMLLADELKDNRIGVSNGGVMTGNWDPVVGGWQRSNLGPAGDGWTGYDFVHAGQTIENSFVLNADELTGGPVTLQVALLIKYTEPKGVGGEVGRTLRLPPATVDVLQFAYRAPHAALDCSRIAISSRFGRERDFLHLEASAGRVAKLGVEVRDWDAKATPASNPDVSTDASTDTVEPLTSGLPVISLSCPDVVESTGEFLSISGTATGKPRGSELLFRADVIRGTLGAPVSDFPGLVRVADPETALSGTGSVHASLDPVTLAVLAEVPADITTFQRVQVRVAFDLPTWQTYSIDPADDNGYSIATAVLPNNPDDPGDDRIIIAYQGNAASGLRFAQAEFAAPASNLDWTITTIDSRPQSGLGVKLGVVSGFPAVLYFDQSREKLVYRVASNSSPSGPSDWLGGDVATSTEISDITSQCVLLIPPSGMPMAVYFDAGTHTIRYASAKIALPLGPGDWTDFQLTSSAVNEQVSAVLHLGRPALAYSDTDFVYVRALVDRPQAITDFVSHLPPHPDSILGPTNYDVHSLFSHVDWVGAFVEGAIVVDSHFMRSTVPDPSKPADWQSHSFRDSYESYYDWSILQLDSHPILVGNYWPSSSLLIARALLPDPDGEADWQVQVAPLVVGNSTSRDARAVAYSNRIVVAYKGEGGFDEHLHLAWNVEAW